LRRIDESETMKSLRTISERSGSRIMRGQIATRELAGAWRLLVKKPRAIPVKPESGETSDEHAFAVAA
jgi:hypothetical protein